jgi:hypothetical protein
VIPAAPAPKTEVKQKKEHRKKFRRSIILKRQQSENIFEEAK